MNQDQINVILSAHLKWLRVEIGGVRANLRGADLNSETIMPAASVLPEEGEFIAYKKVRNGIVLTLLVPEYAARLTGYGKRKSRVSHAIPIRAQRDGNPVADTVFYSLHDSGFKYQLGIVAEVKDFCTDLRRVCAAGIHCYITKKEAEKHQ